MSKLWDIAYRLLGSPRLFGSNDEREAWLRARSRVAKEIYLRVATEAGADEIAQAIKESADEYFEQAEFSRQLESFQKGLGQKAFRQAEGKP